MKKIYLSLIIVISSFTAVAQQKNSVDFGVLAGYGISGIDIGSGSNSSTVIGRFNAGIFTNFYWSESWSLKLKALYDEKGFEQKDIPVYQVYFYNTQGGTGALAQPTYYYMKTSYITVPVTASWHFGDKRRWYLDFGPYIGFLTSARYTDNYVTNQDNKSTYRDTDFGITAEIGYKLPIAKHSHMFIEYGIQNGLISAIPASSNTPGYNNVRESLDIGLSF